MDSGLMISAKTFTTSDPCICCTAISCRTRGGSAAMERWPSFDNTLSPQQYYKTKTADGGTFTFCDSNDANPSIDCDKVSRLTQSYTYSGSCSFAEDGTISGSISMDGKGDFKSSPSSSCVDATGTFTSANKTSCDCTFGGSLTDLLFPSAITGGGKYPVGSGYTLSTSATEKKYTGSAYCTAANDGSNRQAFYTGAVTLTLSDEDTTDDAIARLIAASTWGDWNGGSPTTCLARWEVQTGSGWTYLEAQWKVERTGLLPSHTYTLSIPMQRSDFGAGVYTLYTTVVVTSDTDSSGNLFATGDVPNDEGFDTYADGSGVVITA